VAVVLDGTAVPPDRETQCVHDAAWFVSRLGVELVNLLEMNTEQAIRDGLAQALVNVSAMHMSTCDVGSYPSPSSKVGILREKSDEIDYLVVGNVTVVLDNLDGCLVVTGDRADVVSSSRMPEHDHQRAGTVARPGLRRAMVLSDGASRLVDDFDSLDWRSMLMLVEDAGPERLIDRVRDLEQSDPDRRRWPRNNLRDNASAVVCYFDPNSPQPGSG
jgi:hypothetical protein